MNTHFDHHPRNRYTWESPGERQRNQIDYILIRNRWKSCIKDAKTRPGADGDTDHILLTADIRVTLSAAKKKKHKPQPNLLNLKDSTHRDRYATRLDEVLSHTDPRNTVEEDWKTLKEAVTNTALETLGKKRRVPKKPWISQEVLTLAEEKSTLMKQRNRGTTKLRIRELKAEIQRKVRRDKIAWVEEKCDKIKDMERCGNTKAMFQTIKELTGKDRKKTTQKAIKDREGNILHDEEEVLNRWLEYGTELFKADDQDPQPAIEIEEEDLEPEPLREEVVKELNRLRDGKAAGTDGIPAELLKASGEKAITWLHQLVCLIWRSRQWPKDWKTQEFAALFKAGDMKECGNHRTIALICHASKVLLLIIVERMRQKASQEIPENQAAYKKGRGTRDMLVSLQIISEKILSIGQREYIVFIDYSKAFDSVIHSKLFNILLEMGFPRHLVALIQSLYDGQVGTIKWDGKNTPEFPILKGVRQGCIISPHLFNLYTEHIMREADIGEFGVSVGGQRISNMRYADDTGLLEKTLNQAEELTRRVNETGKRYGLKLNVKKTKLMIVSGEETEESMEIDGEEVETVNRFKYLGSHKTQRMDCTDDIKVRLAQGKSAMMDLKPVWSNSGLPRVIKLKLIETVVWSIMTYGAESWTLKTSDTNRIKATEMWVYRRLLNVHWSEKRTNESILKELNTKRKLLPKVIKAKLSYFGHIERGHGSELSQLAIEGKVEGKRQCGRQRKQWFDNIKEWTGMELDECKRVAQDKNHWKSVVNSSIERVANPRPTRRSARTAPR